MPQYPRLIRFGRCVSVAALSMYLGMTVLSHPRLFPLIESSRAAVVAFNVLGAVGALLAAAAYVTGIWDWSHRFPPVSNRWAWRPFVLFVPFVGAMAYWMWGTRSAPMHSEGEG